MEKKRTGCVGDTRFVSQPRDAQTVITSAVRPTGSRDRVKHSSVTAGQAILVIYGGPEDGSIIPVMQGTTTMGRLPDNHVVIDDPGVSRRHAEVVGTDTGFYLRDLGVTNRTSVNDHDIGETEHLLRHGDEIRLADSNVSLVFKCDAAIPVHNTRPPLGQAVVDALAEPREPQAASGTVEAVTQEPAQHSDDGVYEGTVKLTLELGDDILAVVHLVRELRLMPQIRLLRLASNAKKEVGIWLRLREPLRLKQMLSKMQQVAQVTASPEHGPIQASHVRMIGMRLRKGSQKHLGLIDKHKHEERLPNEAIDDIFAHADRQKASLRYYDRPAIGPNTEADGHSQVDISQ